MNRSRMLMLLTPILLLAACKESTVSKSEELAPELTFETLDQKVSYMYGYTVVKQLEDVGIALDEKYFNQAIKDAQSGEAPRLSDDEQRASSSAFQSMQKEAMNRALKERNLMAGKAFLADNAKREGVHTLASGLQYEVLKEGSGAVPTQNDSVVLQYRGATLDGKVFDSSVADNGATEFEVKETIAGWREALSMMKTGDQWRLFIPAELAYPEGLRTIEPGSVVVYDIHLIEIKKTK